MIRRYQFTFLYEWLTHENEASHFKTNFPVTPIIRYKQLTIWCTTGLFKMLK